MNEGMKIPPRHRIEVAEDVLEVLARASFLIERDASASGVERARALTAVATLALRAVEVREFGARLEAIEAAIGLRKGA